MPKRKKTGSPIPDMEWMRKSRHILPRAKNPLTENPFLRLEKPTPGEDAASRIQTGDHTTEPEE